MMFVLTILTIIDISFDMKPNCTGTVLISNIAILIRITINGSFRHVQYFLYAALRSSVIYAMRILFIYENIFLVTMIQETACDPRKMSVVSDIL